MILVKNQKKNNLKLVFLFVIDRNFFHSLHISDPSKAVAPNGVVLDLRNILHLKSVPSKSSGDQIKIEIEYGDESFKLKFKSESETVEWHRLLDRWKDFFHDYSSLYPVIFDDSDGRNDDMNNDTTVSSVNPLLLQNRVEKEREKETEMISLADNSVVLDFSGGEFDLEDGRRTDPTDFKDNNGRNNRKVTNKLS